MMTGYREETSSNQAAIPVIKLGKLQGTKIEPPVANRTLATENHPTIQAIIHSLFRFETVEQATSRLEAVKKHFIISSRLPKDDDEKTLKLWIRGYDISEDEEKQGYLGNYAAIKVKEIDGKFTLTTEKQRIALKYHPQRKRPRQTHPDWGHPALRVVKKGTIFETVIEAQKVLNQLHEEYPLVSMNLIGYLVVGLFLGLLSWLLVSLVLENLLSCCKSL